MPILPNLISIPPLIFQRRFPAMTIGEKIKKCRTFKGLIQAQLDKLVGLSGDRIQQYESDVRTPKQNKLFEIADALGCLR
jgi:transcriptional regulator with XRE-family HTH domain